MPSPAKRHSLRWRPRKCRSRSRSRAAWAKFAAHKRRVKNVYFIVYLIHLTIHHHILNSSWTQFTLNFTEQLLDGSFCQMPTNSKFEWTMPLVIRPNVSATVKMWKASTQTHPNPNRPIMQIHTEGTKCIWHVFHLPLRNQRCKRTCIPPCVFQGRDIIEFLWRWWPWKQQKVSSSTPQPWLRNSSHRGHPRPILGTKYQPFLEPRHHCHLGPHCKWKARKAIHVKTCNSTRFSLLRIVRAPSTYNVLVSTVRFRRVSDRCPGSAKHRWFTRFILQTLKKTTVSQCAMVKVERTSFPA